MYFKGKKHQLVLAGVSISTRLTLCCGTQCGPKVLLKSVCVCVCVSVACMTAIPHKATLKLPFMDLCVSVCVCVLQQQLPSHFFDSKLPRYCHSLIFCVCCGHTSLCIIGPLLTSG